MNNSGRARLGDNNLTRLLGTVAIRDKRSHPAAFYRRLAAHRGGKTGPGRRNSQLTIAIWHVLNDQGVSRSGPQPREGVRLPRSGNRPKRP